MSNTLTINEVIYDFTTAADTRDWDWSFDGEQVTITNDTRTASATARTTNGSVVLVAIANSTRLEGTYTDAKDALAEAYLFLDNH